MKTTGVFTEHKYEITAKSWNQPLHIIPFGDVHWGARACAEELFIDEISYGKGRTDTWYLGMGDYFDIMSTSERDAISRAGLHEATMDDLDDLYRKRADLFMEKIKHTEGRLIGLIEGNHYARLESGITTTQYMCEQLGCKYLGVMTATRLIVKIQGSSFSYDIIAHHGQGASRLSGGSINRVAQMGEGWDGDLFLMGHDHKSIASREVRCYLDNDAKVGLRIREKVIYSARTGAYLRGFIDKRPSYNADRANRPLPLGGIQVQVTPYKITREGQMMRGLRPKVIV